MLDEGVKSKEYFDWLLTTQLNEIRSHTDPKKMAYEFADIISISIRAINSLGYDPVDILEERKINMQKRMPEIIKKYHRMWKKALKDEY